MPYLPCRGREHRVAKYIELLASLERIHQANELVCIIILQRCLGRFSFLHLQSSRGTTEQINLAWNALTPYFKTSYLCIILVAILSIELEILQQATSILVSVLIVVLIRVLVSGGLETTFRFYKAFLPTRNLLPGALLS